MAKTPKRPRDPNQLAKLITEIATGEEDNIRPDKNSDNAQRKGGLKGGKSRAASLTPEERSQIAQKAAEARWNNKE